ncbi:hypothetical protein BDQ17DRAFT_1303286 [Cyathus striatus]|nr:hypothetical protein BDQ17DRAFT_1303286 [Cyathus striatus]
MSSIRNQEDLNRFHQYRTAATDVAGALALSDSSNPEPQTSDYRRPPTSRSRPANHLVRSQHSRASQINGTVVRSINGRSRSMSVGSRKAPLCIDIIIVGSGIAGLASAFALARSGHRVHVLEKGSGLERRAAGVRVPPNMTKILHQWGLGEKISNSQKCRKSTFHSIETNQLVGQLEWQEDVIKETGGDFLLMHYNDLHFMLYDLALSVGAKVSFNKTVSSVCNDERTPKVSLLSGEVLMADVVVGADGHQSLVRELVTGELDDAVPSGMEFFTIMVPGEALKNDPDWAKWIGASEWPMWMGESRTILGYPVRNGEQFCVHAFWPESDSLSRNEKEGWDINAPTSAIQFGNSHASLRRLFERVPDAMRTRYMLRDIPDDWVDESGKVVVIGEAAHPMMASIMAMLMTYPDIYSNFQPCTIHNNSLAIEDAAVLGGLMSRLHSSEQIPQLLDAFQDLRRERCVEVRKSELRNAELVTLPPGEARDSRDAGMQLSLTEQDWSDEQLREQWENIGEVFGYDAQEEAEDWWIKWGSLGDCRPFHEPFNLVFEVTQVAMQDEGFA